MEALTRKPQKDGTTHYFHGHRRYSFITHDVDELTELRARERTFDGAYIRTALGNITYALVILKIFSPSFAPTAILLLISLHRRSHSNHDLADVYKPKPAPQEAKAAGGGTGGMIWGRAFRTSGVSVVILSGVVTALEVALLVLLWRIGDD
ncbi:hypothetical protein BT69DRAFT_1299439 [Atractiella rhizophila]|nr:hypothetical protein BT69DRAFT_1299439 [Atractiella rhizophila]